MYTFLFLNIGIYVNHLIECLYKYLDVHALKYITLSYSKYNVIRTCYLNRKLLLGGLTLIYLILFYCSTSNPYLVFFIDRQCNYIS